MALHADFAAAISVTGATVQSFLHASHVSGLMRTRFLGKAARKVPFPFTVEYDLFLAEPQVSLEPNALDHVKASMELTGIVIFQAIGKARAACMVRVRFDAGMPVVMVTDEKAETVQFGLNPRKVLIDNFDSKRTKGDDPKPVYGIDPNGPGLVAVIHEAIINTDARQFLFTPPSLDQFIRRKYSLENLTTRITHDSINIGVDVKGITEGRYADLVDLNSAFTKKGWKKAYSQFIDVGEDEDGRTAFDSGWAPTKHRTAGVHGTSLSVSLNAAVIGDIYTNIGRHMVFEQFENDRHEAALRRMAALKDGKSKSYDPTDQELTILRELEVSLADDFLKVKGKATYTGEVAATSEFKFDLRLVRTYVDGITAFLFRNEDKNLLTGEVLNVDIDQPSWVTYLEVGSLIVGVILIPATGGASLVVAVLFDMILAAIVSSKVGDAEGTVRGSLTKTLGAMAKKNGDPATTFELAPGKGPTFVLGLDDLVVSSEGITAWTSIVTRNKDVAVPLPRMGLAYYDDRLFKMVFDDAGALYAPDDPTVRVRWEVFAGTKPMAEILEDDHPLKGEVNPHVFEIIHDSVDLAKYDIFTVRCRVYRPWGDWTQDLFQAEDEIRLQDLDPKLDLRYSFVRWDHTVFYKDTNKKTDTPGHIPGFLEVSRHSKIHHTNPRTRCRFANRYSRKLQKFGLVYMKELPFDPSDKVSLHHFACPYCFFGGPDKMPST